MSIVVNLRYKSENGAAKKFAEEMIAKLREKYDLHMTVERYVSDELPDHDLAFIRK